MWYCKFQTQRWHQKPRLGDLTYQVSHKYAFNIFHLRILDFLDSLKTPQISAILNSSPNNRNRPSLSASSTTSSGKQYFEFLYVCFLEVINQVNVGNVCAIDIGLETTYGKLSIFICVAVWNNWYCYISDQVQIRLEMWLCLPD